MRLLLLLIVLVLFCSWCTLATLLGLNGDTIDIDTTPSIGALISTRAADSSASKSSLSHWLLHVNSRLSSSEKADLEEYLGRRLNAYTGTDTYIIVGDQDLALKAEKHSLVKWVGERTANFRVSRELKSNIVQRRLPGKLRAQQQTTIIWVMMTPTDLLPKRRSNEELVREWEQKFNLDFVIAVSDDKIEVEVPSDHAAEMAMALASYAEVHAIEEKPIISFKNYFSERILTGDPASENAVIWGANMTYLLQVNLLDGRDQLVGISDSGIDWDNCFFWDPAGPPSFNDLNMNARKIVAYLNYSGQSCGQQPGVPCGDRQDDAVAHGTHVSGSAAGQAFTYNIPELGIATSFNGLAANAKIVFTDISPGEGLTPPSDLYSGLLPDPYSVGVRVHTNSWGCSSNPQEPFICNKYMSSDQEIDRFMYEYQDMLVLVAAGNSGANNFNATLESPAVAKNIMCIGASQKTAAGAVTSAQFSNPVENMCGGKNDPACCKDESCTLKMCCATNPNLPCCINSPYLYTSSLENLAYFSARGPCLGADGSSDDRHKPDVVVPGEYIISAHGDASSVHMASPQCELPQGYSSLYNNHQAMGIQSGTSMASPTAAGLCVIVRQYYWDGFYPTGVRTPQNSFNPTAALVKATMINSASHLQGVVGIGSPENLMSLPSLPIDSKFDFMGFGRPNIFSSLRVPGVDTGLFVDDNVNGLTTGQFVTYQFRGVSVVSTPFKVTLAWTDCPGVLGARKALINDLDMIAIVDSSTGIHYLPGQVVYSNGLTSDGDHANNVEKIIMNIGAGVMTVNVTVVGSYIPCLGTQTKNYTAQTYALVANGIYSSVQVYGRPVHTAQNVAITPNIPVPLGLQPPSLFNFTAPTWEQAPFTTPPPNINQASNNNLSFVVLTVIMAICCSCIFVQFN